METARRIGIPIALATVVVVVGYLVLTAGVDRWRAHTDRSGGEPRIPATIRAVSDTLPTTADLGPVGRAGVVFAARSIRLGLDDRIANPWVAVSAGDGTYRALARTDLPPVTRGDAVRVSPDGRLLAWVSDGRLVLYDPTDDTARRVPGVTVLGAFSPDGERVLAFAGGLVVVDLATGETVDLGTDVPASAVAGAAWTPDGAEVTWVADRRLVLAAADGTGSRRSAATTLPLGAFLVWESSGRRLLTLNASGGRLRTWARDGRRLVPMSGFLRARGVYIERLIGSSADGTVQLVGLTSDTGLVPHLLSLDLGTGRATPLASMPTEGDNWVGSETVSFAADALRQPPAVVAAPPSPWSDRAKLNGLLIGNLFVLGVWFTRRRRRRWRWWRRSGRA